MYTQSMGRIRVVPIRIAALAMGLSILGVMVAGGLPGCGRTVVPEADRPDLKKFSSALAFKQYLADQVEEEQYGQRDDWAEDVVVMPAPPPSPSPLPSPMPAPPTSPMPAPLADVGLGSAEPPAASPIPDSDGSDFSTTNVQEEGVDESDVIKNDGEYLYIVSGNRLRIVRAVPADDMAVVSSTELPRTPDELYLRDDTIVALTNRGYYGGAAASTITILDVADRSLPVVQATVELEASLVTSRLIGSTLHVVAQLRPTLPAEPGSAPIVLADVEDLIPNITVTDAEGQITTRELLAWNDLYHPLEPEGYSMTAVITLDLDAPEEPAESAGVIADAETVYVSQAALYLTDRADNGAGELRETTDIYQFDLENAGAVYVGAGTIPGRLLNRFSLGEHEGYLRAATTIGHVARSGDGDATNNVYVLHPVQGQLVITGRVEDIAPGERIYSARFIGTRGFLVTFKKVDPLFTLDLANPLAPRVVGKLKVPGYSDYIHPLGENHLLTIGKDTVDMGDFAWYQGVQLSVFDVTDFAHPRRVDAEVIGVRGTESEALQNPHAFNFYAPTEALAIPVRIYEGTGESPSQSGEHVFTGLGLFRVTTDEGIELLRWISTAAVESLEPDGYWRFSADPAWTRGIFIGDHVYVVTNSKIQAVPLEDLSEAPHQLSID